MKSLAIAFLIGLVTGTIVSCVQDTVKPISSIDPESLKEFDKLGEAQVEGINIILNKIQSGENATSKLSPDQMKKTAEEALTEYLMGLNFEPEVEAEAINLVKNIYNSGSIYSEEAFYNQLTEQQRYFIDKMEESIMLAANAPEAVANILRIEQEALVSLNAEDAFVVVSASTTLRHQLTFWEERLLTASVNGKVVCVGSWKDVGKAALIGAAEGAAACGVARFFGPFGWKVWGACILGGAAGSAVGEAVSQCIN